MTIYKNTSIDFKNVQEDILPITDNAFTLGTVGHRFKGAHLGQGTLYITDAITGIDAGISISNGVLFIDGIAQAQLPNIKVTNLTFSDNTVQTTAPGTPIAYSPVWSATGLTYTGTPATGSYMKVGKLVTFRIMVNCATVTNFGTGQYFLTLPFTPAAHYMFRDAGIHHPASSAHYQMAADAGSTSTSIGLMYSSGAQDQEMNHNSPHALHVEDYFYISGTYECQ